MKVFVIVGAIALVTLWVLAFRRRRVAPSLPPPVPAPPPEPELPPEPVAMAIDGVLDLHHFRPSEVSAVVEAYLDECREAGVLEVRLIHGKGKGVLRRIVHAILERRADVARFGLATDRSGWGATVAVLQPQLDAPPDSV